MNLLKNSDFQAPYKFPSAGEEDVRVVRGLDLIPFRSPNIRVPTDWLCFTCDDDKYVTVEMGLGETEERLFNGHSSVKYFVAGHPHKAGLAQTLWLEPGIYQLRGWAHGWSNHNIPVSDEYKYCNNNGLCTSGVGIGPYFELEGTIGDLNGDPWNDAKFNMMFRLGVTVGEFVSPNSEHVLWGIGTYVYNIFHELPLLEFEVYEPSNVTVYVMSVTRWQFRNADGYLGEMELVRVSDIEDECWGKPREQYERTYVLTPPGMSLEDKHRLLDIYPDYTKGPSADDAGIGALNNKRVIAVDPYKWENSLEDFFAEFYPGTVYEEHILNPQSPGDLLLWQCDPRWRNEKIAGSNCTMTLCQTGCWVASCGSAQRQFGIDPDATPSTVNKALGASGFSGCNTLWSAMKSKLGLQVEKSTKSEWDAQQWLEGQPNHCAFAEVYPGDDTHFVYVERYDEDGGFYCHDPWRNISDYLDNLYPNGVDSWRLIRRANEPPPPTPPPTPNPEPEYPYNPAPIISLHVQGDYRDGDGYGIMEWLRDVRPAAIKFVDGVERARGAKSVSPDTVTVGRFFRTHQGQYWEDTEPEMGAKNFLDEIEDTLRNVPELDYVESLNEVIECGNPWQNERIARFDSTFCYELRSRDLPQKGLMLSAGVGNPFRQEDGVRYPEFNYLTDLEILIPAVEAAIATGSALGPHNYHPVIDGVTYWEKDWPIYAGRPFESWDALFRKHGLYPRYILGESGAVRANSAYSLMPNDGWKTCYNLEGMQADLDIESRYVRDWNTAHGNRIIALLLFTFAGGDKWREFEYKDVFRRMRWTW